MIWFLSHSWWWVFGPPALHGGSCTSLVFPKTPMKRILHFFWASKTNGKLFKGQFLEIHKFHFKLEYLLRFFDRMCKVWAVHMAQHLYNIRFLFSCTELSLLWVYLATPGNGPIKSISITSRLRNWPRRNLSVNAYQILSWDAFQKRKSKPYNSPFQQIRSKNLWNALEPLDILGSHAFFFGFLPPKNVMSWWRLACWMGYRGVLHTKDSANHETRFKAKKIPKWSNHNNVILTCYSNSNLQVILHIFDSLKSSKWSRHREKLQRYIHPRKSTWNPKMEVDGKWFSISMFFLILGSKC